MRLDHVELVVPDRDAAAAWYEEWLGFRAMPEHVDWSAQGPLMLTNDGGHTMLALFQCSLEASMTAALTEIGWRRIAFRVSGGDFLAFIARYRAAGYTLSEPRDHAKAWSVYFADPWRNKLEVTTYDYQLVGSALRRE